MLMVLHEHVCTAKAIASSITSLTLNLGGTPTYRGRSTDPGHRLPVHSRRPGTAPESGRTLNLLALQYFSSIIKRSVHL